jgi:acyl carrier protein
MREKTRRKGVLNMFFEKVRDIIAKQLDIDAGTITMNSRLIDDLKADSLDIVELIMDLEQEFNIEIPDEELPKVQTVSDIVGYLDKK